MSVHKKFAAIDIGSNAIRLLVYTIFPDLENNPVYKKVALTRVPIRLGEDVFVNQKISPDKQQRLEKAMIAFKNLMDLHDVVAYKACATSAMREAQNGPEVIRQIFERTGVQIEIISGSLEADLIYNNHIAEGMSEGRAYLYIDVGGGSTELTLFSKGKKRFSESFNIGTVRMLHDKVTKDDWNHLKNKCGEIATLYKNIIGIGSGGNIIKLKGLTGENEQTPVTRSQLKEVYTMLRQYTYEERMRKFEMNADRADVIIPAAEIFLYILKHAEVKSVIVPKIGLSDGIIKHIYEEYMASRTIL